MFSHAFTVLLLIVSVGVEGSEVGRNTLRSMQCLLTLMLPALYFFAASYLTPRLRRREEAPPSRKQNAANTAAAAATSTLQTPPSLDAPRLSLWRRPWGGGARAGRPCGPCRPPPSVFGFPRISSLFPKSAPLLALIHSG